MQSTHNWLIEKLHGYNCSWSFDIDVSIPYSNSISKDFSQVLDALNEQNIEYFLADGALLGLVRDKNLIKHDTDIDFYLLGDENEEKITNLMFALGYQIGRHVKKFKTTYQIAYYNNNKSIIDFCFWRRIQSNDYYIWFVPEIKTPLRLHTKYVKGNSLISWNGREIRTFLMPEIWLENVYGADWRVPDLSKGDWRLRGDY